jgi:hypothetical protein
MVATGNFTDAWLSAPFGPPGLVGGLVYWLIAGRKAGVERKPRAGDVG